MIYNDYSLLELYSILFCYFLSSTNCELNITTAPRIIGGTRVTDRSQFAYQALLLYDDGNQNSPICGGTIIDEDHVLTAAHCILSRDVASTLVVVGNLDLDDHTILKKVQKIYVHEQYSDETTQDDIALLKMLVGFGNWTSDVRPIDLKTNETTRGLCIVSGFGTTRFGGEEKMNSRLMYAEVRIVRWTTCRRYYKHKLSANAICAAATGKDSCRGDSGGPLVCSGKLVGIVSVGTIECGSGEPGVYTEVARYLKWIKNHGGPAYTSTINSTNDSPASHTAPPLPLLNFISLFVILFIFKIVRNL